MSAVNADVKRLSFSAGPTYRIGGVANYLQPLALRDYFIYLYNSYYYNYL